MIRLPVLGVLLLGIVSCVFAGSTPTGGSQSPDPSIAATLVLDCLNELDQIYRDTPTGQDYEAMYLLNFLTGRKFTHHELQGDAFVGTDRARLTLLYNVCKTAGHKRYRVVVEKIEPWRQSLHLQH